MPPKVTVILLNWNRADQTLRCLAAMANTNYSNFEVLVVDNGSSDDSVQRIRTSFPNIEILETGENLGYAGGNNVGIRHALERGAEYFWILNNDTVTDPDCLERLVAAARLDDHIGMVGAKIYYLDAPGIIWYAGGTIDLQCGMTRHIGKDEPDSKSVQCGMETEFITGCSILAKREMILEVGLLDENYFLYFEDVDWCLRARQAGWKLYFEPHATLLHAEGAQQNSIYSDRFIYYTLRNRLYFMKKFAPRRMAACHLLQLKSALYFIKLGLSRGIGSGASASTLTCALRAYTDFYLRRRMGKKT